MKIRLLPSAKADLRRGKRFYDSQEDGLGAYFLDSLSADIDSLQLFAGIHPTNHGHHRFLADRFPYWIYYRIDSNIIFVVAVLDARQHPSKIFRREKYEEARRNKPG